MAEIIEILIDDFVIDASLDETHVFASEVTDLPLEKGVIASDHIRTVPQELTVRGIVSNTPIGDLAQRRALTSAAPVQDALEWLNAIYVERRLVTVATSLRLYVNMAMPRLEIIVNPETGDALRFTASFKEYVFFENETTVEFVGQQRNKKKSKKGPQATPEVKDYSNVTKKTLLSTAVAGKWDEFNSLLKSPLSNERLGI